MDFKFGAVPFQHRYTWHQLQPFPQDFTTNSEVTATGVERTNLAVVHHLHVTQGRHAEPADMPLTDLIATEDDQHYSVQSEGKKPFKNINCMVQSANVMIKVANPYITLL